MENLKGESLGKKASQSFVLLFLIIIVFTLKFRPIISIKRQKIIEEVNELLGIHLIGLLHTKLSKTGSDIKCCQSFWVDGTLFILDVLITEQVSFIEFEEER